MGRRPIGCFLEGFASAQDKTAPVSCGEEVVRNGRLGILSCCVSLLGGCDAI